jgi:hypothetical protein
MTAKTTASPIGISRLETVAPDSEPDRSCSCTDMADMPVKCIPLNAIPMISSDATMTTGRCTVAVSHSATVGR